MLTRRFAFPEFVATDYRLSGSTTSNACRCRAFNSASAAANFRFSQHLWRAQDARRLPIDGALCRNKVALRSSMGQRWGHVVSVARLIQADVP